MRRTISSLALALVLAAAAPEATPPATSGIELRVAGHSNATPSIAASGRFVAVVWGASTKEATHIYAAVSRDGGRTSGAPVRVSDSRTLAKLSGEQRRASC